MKNVMDFLIQKSILTSILIQSVNRPDCRMFMLYNNKI